MLLNRSSLSEESLTAWAATDPCSSLQKCIVYRHQACALCVMGIDFNLRLAHSYSWLLASKSGCFAWTPGTYLALLYTFLVPS